MVGAWESGMIEQEKGVVGGFIGMRGFKGGEGRGIEEGG